MMTFLKTLFGGAQRINPQQYRAEFAASARAHMLIDVRTAEEFRAGHIPGAINVDVQTLPQQLHRLPRDRALVLYCRSGSRSSYAAGLLRQAGFSDVYDLGGIGDWHAAGLPINTGS